MNLPSDTAQTTNATGVVAPGQVSSGDDRSAATTVTTWYWSKGLATKMAAGSVTSSRERGTALLGPFVLVALLAHERMAEPVGANQQAAW